MNQIVQMYRGSSAQNDTYTGLAGELVIDTTKNSARVHDGETKGGHELNNLANHIEQVDTQSSAISELENYRVKEYAHLIHNGIYRGENLLDKQHFASIDDIQAAVAKGDFTDIYVGDYITDDVATDTLVSGSSTEYTTKKVKFYVAGINKGMRSYSFYTLDGTSTVVHNYLCLVSESLGSFVWNTTDTTDGGYAASSIFNNTLVAYLLSKLSTTYIYNYLLAPNEYYTTANTFSSVIDGITYNGDATDYATAAYWYALLSEMELFGSQFYSASHFDYVNNTERLPIFRFIDPSLLIPSGERMWLKDIHSESQACCVYNNGTEFVPDYSAAGNSLNVCIRAFVG